MEKISDLNNEEDSLMATVKVEDLNDIYRNIAEEIGFENTVIVYNMFRGTQVSFPNRMLSKEYIYKSIVEEYNGDNVSQLAKKYNYTERTVWRIIKQNEEKSYNG